MSTTIELVARREGDEVALLAPGPGWFTRALPEGALVGGGAAVGVLRVLGREHALRAPAGVHGRVVSARPERIDEPVGAGAELYRLAPLAAGDDAGDAVGPAEAAATGLVLTSPQTGRFYHRPGPDEPAFAAPGDELAEGQPVGLIEVMKTFAHVPYRAQAGLPQRARVVRVLVEDGAEVRRDQPLLEVEPA